MKLVSVLFMFLICMSCRQANPPRPLSVIPEKKQIEWQQMEYYAFIHFGPNTFTGVEWGDGEENPDVFRPTGIDCAQWVKVCKDAGMKGLVLTVKHHDGFCLWPSEQSTHTVKESSWMNGKGDVVKLVADECKRQGLKFGVYLSPWDMNHPSFTTNEYNAVYVETIKELLTSYGEIFEFWYDGGDIGKNGKRQVYDWDRFDSTILSLQPNIVINGCRHLRWVGNEEGYAPETCWSTISRDSVSAADRRADGSVLSLYGTGLENGDRWAPAECDVSIRPGWFFHEKDDNMVKTLPHIVDIYMNSVGRNATLILNLPPNKQGLIPSTEVERLMALRKYLDQCFANNLLQSSTSKVTSFRGNLKEFSIKNTTDQDFDTYWATDDHISAATATFSWKSPQAINAVMLGEYIALGQRVKSFNIEILENDIWKKVSSGTTVGYKKIVRFDKVSTTSLRINIAHNREAITISSLGAYFFPDIVTEPSIFRNREGKIVIACESENAAIYYSTDGSEPTLLSSKYAYPIECAESVTVKAKVYVNDNKDYSETITTTLTASKQGWKIVACSSEAVKHLANYIIDENKSTFWMTSETQKTHPHHIIIDMSTIKTIKGFSYLPRQDGRKIGNISEYSFFISNDGQTWQCVINKGQFDNIANKPILQQVFFKDTYQAKYFKFVTHNDSYSLENTSSKGVASASEIGIYTE